MKVCYDKCGSQLRSMAEYPIDPAQRVMAGQVVCLRQGRVVPAERAECGCILGVAGEDHTGQRDILDPRATGTHILVYDSPMAVCESPAPEAVARGGDAGCIWLGEGFSGGFADGAFAGGYAVLTAKAEDSEMIASVGTAFQIADSCGTEKSLTVTGMLGMPAKGDRFAILPPVLFSGGVLDETGSVLNLLETCDLSLRIIGGDAARRRIFTLARRHCLAVSDR
ncbi:MAG: hypothetical protein IKT60_03720 [Clostridia bacterium]|nr:hypothetical protein [Clostridia bacterium]